MANIGRPRKNGNLESEKTPKGRGLLAKKVETKTGVTITSCYCRKCMKIKKPIDFSDATDLFLDSNGKMSICKDCCNDIYAKVYENEKDINRAVYRTCRILNVAYSEEAIRAVQIQISSLAERGAEIVSFFTLYKGKLGNVQRTSLTERKATDLTFVETSLPVVENDLAQSDMTDESQEYLKKYWGSNFTFEDYEFLEFELSEWKKTHKCDTKAEETLLKEICHKSLEIKKARVEGKGTAALVKELQDLMKTASVDPAKTAIAGSGRSQDTFSAFIKTIEENEPADYYKDKKLFKDFDNIDFYFKKYVKRPILNFLGSTKDFNVETDEDFDDEDKEVLDADILKTLPE
jgi:hypothetical protein